MRELVNHQILCHFFPFAWDCFHGHLAKLRNRFHVSSQCSDNIETNPKHGSDFFADKHLRALTPNISSPAAPCHAPQCHFSLVTMFFLLMCIRCYSCPWRFCETSVNVRNLNCSHAFFGSDRFGWVFDRWFFQLYGVFIGWFVFVDNMFYHQKCGANATMSCF